MATRPSEETYQTPSSQADNKPAKIEAAVRGITPSQPAPIVEAKSAAKSPADSVSLFGKIAAFFFGEKKSATPVIKPSETNGQRSRNNRNRNRNGRDSRDGRDGSRETNRDRTTPAEGQIAGQERKPRTSNPPAQANVQAALNGSEPRNEQRNKPSENKAVREPREPREPRPPRPPRVVADTTSTENTVSPAPTFADAESGTSEGTARSGRRSRGRGGRGGRGQGDRSERTERAEQNNQSGEGSTDIDRPIKVAESLNTEPTQAPIALVASPIISPVATADLVPATSVMTEATASPPTEVTVNAQQENQTVIQATQPTQATAVASPVASIVAEPASDFSANLEQAGLIMVQTVHTAPATNLAPTQPLGRKPKPVIIAPSEPLQMIETKPN